MTISTLIYLTLLLYELVPPAPHQMTVCDNAATVPAPRLEGPSAALACRTQGTKNKAPARKSLKRREQGRTKSTNAADAGAQDRKQRQIAAQKKCRVCQSVQGFPAPTLSKIAVGVCAQGTRMIRGSRGQKALAKYTRVASESPYIKPSKSGVSLRLAAYVPSQ